MVNWSCMTEVRGGAEAGGVQVLQWGSRDTLCTPCLSYVYLGCFVCVSVCHNCRTLCYSFSFNNQTDQGDETEGLEMEGLEMER
jgi:hypothetical protein